MAESDYDGDGTTWVTPKANTNGSGTSTFWDNSFKPTVDRIKYLYDRLFGSTAATITAALTFSGGTTHSGTTTITGAVTNNNASGYQIASTSEARVTRCTPYFDTTKATYDGQRVTTTSTSAFTIVFELEVPSGQELTGVDVYLKGGSGHAGLPASTPTVALDSVDVVTPAFGSYFQFGTDGTDTSANVTAYETHHHIHLTVSSSLDRSTSRYYLTITTESGANAAVGAVYYHPLCTYTRTKVGQD